MTTSEEIKWLEDNISRYQESYYEGNPEISDSEFDSLWDKLKELDPHNPILTKKVGKDDSDFFPKTAHLMIMGSQEKANTEEDMSKWLGTVDGDTTISWKLDGASLELQYENGVFKKAVTRGDAEIGDDVTSNVVKMNGVVKNFEKPFTGAVRGEVLLSKENKKKYFADKKNCRNAATGTMKRKDGEGCEHLDVVVYDAQYLDRTQTFETQENLQNWLLKNGFIVADWKLVKGLTAKYSMDYLKEVFDNLDKIPYDIDGLVFKQNKIDMDDITTNVRPKTQIALKPARTYATATVTNIIWNNTNGSFTPVCEFTPTELLGSTITHASAYNIQFLLDMKLEIGDVISFTRCGEIIPGVARNITKGTVNSRLV